MVVSDADERPLQAWTYVVNPEARERLTDEPWDRHLFEILHLKAFLHAITA